jgi:nucleoside-diphosphate-sugar epimerase
MNILITGATGFIGSHLLPKLSRYTLKVVVRKYSDIIDKNMQILLNKDLEHFRCEIERFSPEVVIHLASCMIKNDDFSSIENIIESNIIFTTVLLKSLRNTPVKYFINTGTFAEYYLNDGILNPAYLYSASKNAARYIIKYFKNLMGFKAINIIPYTVYGKKSREKKIIDYIFDSLNSDIPVEMTQGEQVLDFVHVDDVTDFYADCVENRERLSDETDYHLGTGVGTSIRELVKLIENKTNKKANILWGKRPYRDLDIMKSIAPLENIKKLGWFPRISLEAGLEISFIL